MSYLDWKNCKHVVTVILHWHSYWFKELFTACRRQAVWALLRVSVLLEWSGVVITQQGIVCIVVLWISITEAIAACEGGGQSLSSRVTQHCWSPKQICSVSLCFPHYDFQALSTSYQNWDVISPPCWCFFELDSFLVINYLMFYWKHNQKSQDMLEKACKK